jgi:hypothetical protein
MSKTGLGFKRKPKVQRILGVTDKSWSHILRGTHANGKTSAKILRGSFFNDRASKSMPRKASVSDVKMSLDGSVGPSVTPWEVLHSLQKFLLFVVVKLLKS